MIKYRVGRHRIEITPTEIERETVSSVWINGVRQSKDSTYSRFFDTFGEAKKHIVRRTRHQLDRVSRQLDTERNNLHKALSLTETPVNKD